MTDAGQDGQQRYAQGDHRDEGNGPDLRQFAAGEGEEDDCEQVLQDQDANRGPPMHGAVLAAIIQVFDGKDGGGEGERKPQRQRALPRQAGERAQARSPRRQGSARE
jgi:hypothetical protein